MDIRHKFENGTNQVTIQPARSAPRWVMTRLGALIVIGYVSVSLIAAGVVQILKGEAHVADTLALIVAGATAATIVWRSAGRIMDSIETPDTIVKDIRGKADRAIATSPAISQPRSVPFAG